MENGIQTIDEKNINLKSLGEQRSSIKGIAVINEEDPLKWPERFKKAFDAGMYPFLMSFDGKELSIDDAGDKLGYLIHKTGNLVGTKAKTLLLLRANRNRIESGKKITLIK